MKDEKFTPGKWKAVINEALEDDHNCDVYDSNNNCICECFSAGNCGDETGISEQQKEANMYLIAAAPEMYRMLESVHRLLNGYLLYMPIRTDIKHQQIEFKTKQIEELLKKARGEE